MDARAPNYELAEVDYMSGMKYKDIAEKYSVSMNTVKSWKKRYAWNRKEGAHKTEKGCTQNKLNKSKKKEPVAKEVESVLKNTELTEKQRLFCLFFVKCFNATKAYQKAYGCRYETAAAIGYRLLENVGVKNEIQRLKQEKMNQVYLTEADIFQKYMDIAFTDITDFIFFRNEEIEVKDDAGTMHKVTVSSVNVRNDYEVDGTLISEVSKGKDGVKVKLADRMKALYWLTAHMDMATAEQKARVELLNAQREKLTQEAGADDSMKDKAKQNIFGILEQMHLVEDEDMNE